MGNINQINRKSKKPPTPGPVASAIGVLIVLLFPAFLIWGGLSFLGVEAAFKNFVGIYFITVAFYMVEAASGNGRN